MPTKSEIRDGIIHTDMIGELTIELVKNHMDFIVSLNNRLNNYYEVIDMSGVTGIHIYSEGIRELSYYGKQTEDAYPHISISFYVQNNFHFGMARMLQIYFEIIEHPAVFEISWDKVDALQYIINKKKKYG